MDYRHFTRFEEFIELARTGDFYREEAFGYSVDEAYGGFVTDCEATFPTREG